eukprot:gene21012-biopygen7081
MKDGLCPDVLSGVCPYLEYDDLMRFGQVNHQWRRAVTAAKWKVPIERLLFMFTNETRRKLGVLFTHYSPIRSVVQRNIVFDFIDSCSSEALAQALASRLFYWAAFLSCVLLTLTDAVYMWAFLSPLSGVARILVFNCILLVATSVRSAAHTDDVRTGFLEKKTITMIYTLFIGTHLATHLLGQLYPGPSLVPQQDVWIHVYTDGHHILSVPKQRLCAVPMMNSKWGIFEENSKSCHQICPTWNSGNIGSKIDISQDARLSVTCACKAALPTKNECERSAHDRM